MCHASWAHPQLSTCTTRHSILKQSFMATTDYPIVPGSLDFAAILGLGTNEVSQRWLKAWPTSVTACRCSFIDSSVQVLGRGTLVLHDGLCVLLPCTLLNGGTQLIPKSMLKVVMNIPIYRTTRGRVIGANPSVFIVLGHLLKFVCSLADHLLSGGLGVGHMAV